MLTQPEAEYEFQSGRSLAAGCIASALLHRTNVKALLFGRSVLRWLISSLPSFFFKKKKFD
jgi:hypothetical protein